MSPQWREWRGPLLLLLSVVFFIPMRRYTLPSSLPFHLEPYRPVVALILGCWVLGLLAMRVTVPRTSLSTPILAFCVVILASLAINPARISPETYKFLSLFATFFVVYLLVTSIVHTRDEVDFVVGALVLLGAIVGFFALVEARLGFSPFVGLERLVPVLQPLPVDLATERGTRFRAFASSEHPIALGAMLTMLAPFALYLAVTQRRAIWWMALTFLAIGAVSTVSRTAVVMLVVIVAMLALVRWQDVRRFWFIILPMIAVVHVMLPGTMGTLREAFMPSGGLIAEQQTYADSLSTGGRVADIAPSLAEFERRPFLGDGLGTRITTGDNVNARLLDNQWLGLLLDTGLAGVLAFVLVIGTFVRRQFRLARSDPSTGAYLPLACASSVLAYAFGMFTYDAFSFTQTTFVFFVIMALGVTYERLSFLESEKPAGVVLEAVGSRIPALR